LLRKNTSDQLSLSVYFFRSGSNFCSFVSSDAVPLGVWIHLAATFDENDSSSVGTLYINGIRQTLSTNSCSSMVSASTTLYPAIGASKYSNNGASATFVNNIGGSIDNVRFYFDDLTQAQVAYDYNRGAPLAHYKFDECQGTTANNSAPAASGGDSGNDGTITIGATGTYTSAGTCGSGTSTEAWNAGSTGKRNYALGFDGTNDYVEVADVASLRVDNSAEDFSVFAWIKRTTTGAGYLISKEDADDDGWRLQFNSSNFVVCSQDATDITSLTAITDTNWHHVGCTIDRDGAGIVYIDGKPNGVVASMGTDTMATTSNIRIGTRSYTSTSYFNGLIDDVRIYNYALTQNQIKQIMNNGAMFFGPATGSP